MKNILLIIALFPYLFYSQELKFEKVVKVDSTISKDELYNKARLWANENFNSKNNIVNTEDKEDGEISGSGIFDYRTEEKYKGRKCVEGPIKYKFNIFVRDGKYKYIFHSFDHKGSGGSGCRRVDYGIITLTEEAPAKGKGIQYNLGYADVKAKVTELVGKFVSSLERYMKKTYEGKGDW